MTTSIRQRVARYQEHGMPPLRIEFLEVRSGLPAAVWKLLSVAERPGDDPFSDTVRPIIVNDKCTRAVVLTENHYNMLIGRLNDLDRWLGECLAEQEGPAR
jgi:hypothetical protein